MLMRLAIAVAVLVLLCGCGVLPQVVHQPTYHNPFPQLSKVAIAPFFNLSVEPTVDGRQFAQAYFNELQLIPGFEVAPMGAVEKMADQYKLSLASPAEVRKLAQLLQVDAVVIGAITDFSPYYPPRCSLQVEWYAANPCFHPIPVGYGLPWGTSEEEYIPDTLVEAAEFNLAREQLKTQTPEYSPDALIPINADSDRPKSGSLMALLAARPPRQAAKSNPPARDSSPPLDRATPPTPAGPALRLSAEEALPARPADATALPPADELPSDWPDPRGLIPPPPATARPASRTTMEPVLTHTKTYNGHDVQFTAALQNYAIFRDDARFGGWQSYLQRSDDFIRFCCHLHITEMLTARGAAGETRVVWRWPDRR